MDRPKILFLDIETFPNVGYSWGKWEQNVIEFTDHWYVLCFGYKWQGEKTKVVALPDFKGYKPLGRDEKLLVVLHDLLDQADIVVGQNGDRFDLPKINTRFLQFGMPPPSPYKTVDTLKVARAKFAFNSNKLDDLGRDLELGRKVHHEGFPLWLGCAQGDKKAWAKMKKYNKQDVELLEKVYNKFLPWISNHPSTTIYSDSQGCPKCGSKDLQQRGFSYSKTTRYKQFVCKTCGGWSRYPMNLQEVKPLIGI